MCSVPTKKQATRTMSAPAANPKYNPTQTTPFVVKIELMNKETDGSGKHFGFLKLITSPFPEGHKKSGKFRVHVSLDVSGSMTEQGRLALAKETIAKMVEFLASASKENPDLHFWLTLTTFSNEAEIFIDNAKVSEESAPKLTSTVEKLCTKQATNFEASFKLDREVMEKQAIQDAEQVDEDMVTIHIMMTDGEITLGNTNEDELKGMLLADVEHVFIGYGSGHKAGCLMNLASVNDKSSYLFLDHPTKMGAMFAQIFCPHLFTSISDVEIELTDAKFLDIESGLEVETLFIKRIAADTTKTFHLFTDPRIDAVHYADGDEDRHRVKEIYVRMQFRSFDNADLDEPPNYPFCKLFSVVSATTHSLDVQKERKRWAVLVLMKDAKELKHREQARQQHEQETRNYWFDASMFKEERDALIHRATELKDEIKEFAEQNGIADDEMLKDLTTDLVICICAIPSQEHGLMYINSRFRSCTDETPTAVSDLTPLDDYVQDYVHSSGFNCGDDRLFSCGGDNEQALHRQRSGAANAAYDNMARVMSQDLQEPQEQQHQQQVQVQQLQRRNSSYRQQQPQSDYVNLNHNDDDSFSNSSHVVITNDDDNYNAEPCSDNVPSLH